MQKISQLICLTAFLVLVATTCMAGSAVNQVKIAHQPDQLHDRIRSDYCFTLTMKDQACHQGHCSDSTTYVHTCDSYNSTNCDYYSGRIDICNSTSCQNTTRHIDACYHDVVDNCGDTDISCHSCTNGICRNRTTHFHACYTNTLTSLKDSASAFCNGCYIGIYAFDCIGEIMKSFGRRLVNGK